MDRKKLTRIRREIRQMQKSPQGRRANDLITLALQLKRTRFNRGKEPTYIREDSPALTPPLSIPNHPGEMSVGTVRSILNQLAADCDEWEEHLDKLDAKSGDEDE